MKRFAATALSALVMLAGLAPAMPSAAAAVRPAAPAAVITAVPAAMPRSSACVAHWGSTPKHAGKTARSHVLRVRAGQHPCFDRLPFRVLVLNGPDHQSRLVIDVAHHWHR